MCDIESVTSEPTRSGGVPVEIRAPLLVAASLALIAGLYARFKGLGVWPLGVDEFYISRSIDNILRSGLPRFSCGGYYNRGVAYQYLVAGLRLCGFSAETAGRSIAAVCSVAVLPAAYLIGKRLRGPLAGWLTVIILCVSIWEIEMARFARMYAPFQAVFAWYAVFYLRYTLDARREGLIAMAALSVLGALTWEGGVVLGVANLWAIVLAHGHGRLRAADWGRLGGLFVLLMALYFFGTNDFRDAGEPHAAQVTALAQPAAQTGIAETALSGAAAAPEGLARGLVGAAVVPLTKHHGWALGWLVPLALALASLRSIASYRGRWLSGAGLCLILAAAALHLFTLAFGTLALMLLSGLIDRRELAERHSWSLLAALAAFFLFWAAFDHWAGGIPNVAVDRGAIGAAVQPVSQHLFGFPDVYDALIRPWGRTLPVLTIGMGLALGYLFLKEIRGGRRDAAAVLLSLLVLMVLLIGMTPAPRIETRYTFFLYPLLIALAVTALLELAARIPALRRAPLAVSAAVPLICFAATEDFQPRHIAADRFRGSQFPHRHVAGAGRSLLSAHRHAQRGRMAGRPPRAGGRRHHGHTEPRPVLRRL